MAISLEEFRRRITAILGEDADEIRSRYIKSFVNTEADHYRERIAQKRRFADGSYYVGYLWDFLKQATPIFEEEAKKKLAQKERLLYVFWDLHSAERILVKDYWKFPKDAVLVLSVSDLIAGMEFLPEDIYIFDDRFDWSIILTHEYTTDQKRWCREAKPD